MSVWAVGLVVGSNGALTNDLEVVFAGSMEKALDDHTSFGRGRSGRLGCEELAGISAQAEVGGGDHSGKHGDGEQQLMECLTL